MGLYVLHYLIIKGYFNHTFEMKYNCSIQYRPFVTTFANSYELFPSLSKITNFVRISCTKFTCEFAYKFVHEFVYEFAKTKEKIRARISEIRARILKEESNLCANLNKPTRLHQDRNPKTSYFDNFMVSF